MRYRLVLFIKWKSECAYGAIFNWKHIFSFVEYNL